MRNVSTPARNSALSMSGEELAGPTVATILARRFRCIAPTSFSLQVMRTARISLTLVSVGPGTAGGVSVRLCVPAERAIPAITVPTSRASPSTASPGPAPVGPRHDEVAIGQSDDSIDMQGGIAYTAPVLRHRPGGRGA